MCTPEIYRQSGGFKLSPNSMGGRLDKAQREATANYGGGSAPRTNMGSTILGTPRNSDQMAIRNNTLLEI
mgnify:CR=1 FL=1|tara:strand:+ start:5018 stop:5227 length:210 start_codon:yes stop_codon:yes gene_type:complete